MPEGECCLGSFLVVDSLPTRSPSESGCFSHLANILEPVYFGEYSFNLYLDSVIGSEISGADWCLGVRVFRDTLLQLTGFKRIACCRDFGRYDPNENLHITYPVL